MIDQLPEPVELQENLVKPPENRLKLVGLFVLVVLLCLGIALLTLRNNQLSNNNYGFSGTRKPRVKLSPVPEPVISRSPVISAPDISPSPRAQVPIPSGPQTYNISTASEYTGPRMTRVEFSQFPTRMGETSTVTVTVNLTTPAIKVVMAVNTDSKVVDVPLTLANTTDTTQVWTGNWQLEDTIEQHLRFSFSLDGASGQARSNIVVRKPRIK